MSAISKMLINMVPAMEELCALEGRCPIASASSNQQAHQLARHPAQRYAAASPSSSSSTLSGALAFRSLVPSDHPKLVERLTVILQSNLAPATYAEKLVSPFLNRLIIGGPNWFADQLTDKEKPIERIAHAILQNFDPTTTSGVIPLATTKALREVVSDMYQVFLQNKCKLEAPVKCLKTPSPLPNWYQEGLSTYPRPIKAFGSDAAIVNVPSRYASHAAITWGCLGHEVAGHDILGAFPDALAEIKGHLHAALGKKDNLNQTTPHWNGWLEEAAADVLGILNVGPAGALSQIAFFRALSGKDKFKLSSMGQVNDDHPIDLVRGYLAAFTVKHMSTKQKPFDKAADYAGLIRAEVDKDATGVDELQVGTLVLGKAEDLERNLGEFCKMQKLTLPQPPFLAFLGIGNRSQQLHEWVAEKCADTAFTKAIAHFFEAKKKVPQSSRAAMNSKGIKGMTALTSRMSLKDFKESAEIVAHIIMHTKLKTLGGRSFHEIKSWTNKDEKICNIFREFIQSKSDVNPLDNYNEGCFASHVVAAAVLASVLEKGSEKISSASIQVVFKKMITILQAMHRTNPEWKLSTSAQVAPSQAASSLPSSGLSGAVGAFINDLQSEKENRPVGFGSANSTLSNPPRKANITFRPSYMSNPERNSSSSAQVAPTVAASSFSGMDRGRSLFSQRAFSERSVGIGGSSSNFGLGIPINPPQKRNITFPPAK